MTYEQCPKILYSAVTAIEDQHFEQHWASIFHACSAPRFETSSSAASPAEASTISMQLAGNLFWTRSDRSFRRKMQEISACAADRAGATRSRKFSPCTPIRFILAHGKLRLCRRRAILFWAKTRYRPETSGSRASRGAWVNAPEISPLSNPEAALSRRNLVIHRMEEEGKITPAEEANARKSPLGLHIQYPRNDLRLISSKEIRKYLESTYGTEARPRARAARLHPR